MQKAKLSLAALALIVALPGLQGCVEVALLGTAAASGVMSAHDRRSTGTQTDDETTEWKANNHVPAQYKDTLAGALSLSPDLGPGTLGLLILISIAAALAGSSWGIRQILRLSPMEAIRNE